MRHEKIIFTKQVFIFISLLVLVSCESPSGKIVTEQKKETILKVNNDSIEMAEALKTSMGDDSLFAEMVRSMNDTSAGKKEFPEARQLDSNATTEFVPTLEHKLNHKNNIYAASFLFAWDEVRTKLKSIKERPENSQDFCLVNRSVSFKEALSKKEYTITVVATKSSITVLSSIHLSLEFRPRLENLGGALNFNGTMVNAFGLKHSRLVTGGNFQILYFKDENNFILKLIPYDKTQEIILAKGVDMKGSFSDVLNRTENLIKSGEQDRKVNPSFYTLSHKEDFISIPCISFSFDKIYSGILHQKIESAMGTYTVSQARQRTSMILNESGAKLLSLSMVKATKAMRPNKPKSLVFNKPFFMMFRKVNSKYPYFAMTVTNPDLMTKTSD